MLENFRSALEFQGLDLVVDLPASERASVTFPDKPFADELACHEAIGRVCAARAPAGWSRLEVQVMRFAEDMELTFASHMRGGTTRPVEPVPPELWGYFEQLAKLVSNEEKGLYKTCRFILDLNGTFEAKFDY